MASVKGETGFLANLGKVYGLYTGGFFAFVIFIAILEQLGVPNIVLGYLFVGFTIFVYALIGILSRTARSVPYERIQDVSLEQNLLARVFGLVAVRFETGAGGADDIALTYLAESEGEELRDLVRQHRNQAGPLAAPATVDAPEETRVLFAMGPRRVLTFGIGGKGKLPPRTVVTLAPVDDPDYKVDSEAAARGATVFGGRCTQCHGIEANAAGSAPDLRTSAFILQAEGFHGIVKEGALLPNGMPRFDVLTSAQVEDIRQYIRAQAAAWRGAKRAGK